MNRLMPLAAHTSEQQAPAAARSRFKTAALVVTYQAPASVIPALAALIRQVDALVVVDNGSTSETKRLLEQFTSPVDFRVIFNPNNIGIAAALNLGMDYAAERQCDLVVLLDQDSIVGSDFISDMAATYAHVLSSQKSHSRLVGMIVPTYIDQRSSAPMPLTSRRNGSVLTAMTSGTLLPMSTYRYCGRFEESLFIDYVDLEYCLRLEARGLSIIQSSSATLLHSLGRMRSYTFGPLHFSVTNHSAARRSYISRNRTILQWRYLLRRPGWVARDLRAMVTETIKIALVEDNRWQKLLFTLKGIEDAVRGRMGYRVSL